MLLSLLVLLVVVNNDYVCLEIGVVVGLIVLVYDWRRCGGRVKRFQSGLTTTSLPCSMPIYPSIPFHARTWMRLVVPVKQRSTTSSARPTASNTCRQ